jgi:hypothetical protein
MTDFSCATPERHQTAIWSVHLYVIVTVMPYMCRFVYQCTVWSAFSTGINFGTDTTGSTSQHDLQPRAMHVMRVSCRVNVPFDVIAENHRPNSVLQTVYYKLHPLPLHNRRPKLGNSQSHKKTVHAKQLGCGNYSTLKLFLLYKYSYYF